MTESGDDLQTQIDATAQNARVQIESLDRGQWLRSKFPAVFSAVLAFSVLALLFQIARWSMGYSAWPLTWLLIFVPATLLYPALWLVFDVSTRRHWISRQRALHAVDQQLRSSERIATADHFLQQESRDGFMQAAVEDAAQWAQRGRKTRLSRSSPDSPWSPQSIVCLVGSVVAIVLAGYLSTFSRAVDVASLDESSNVRIAENMTVQSERDRRDAAAPENRDDPRTTQPDSPREKRSQPSVNRQGSAGAMIPENAEPSQGKLNEGETRESQQSSNPSSARGAPSASGQPSKSGDESKKKPKKKEKKSKDKERPKKERKQDDKPSGATAGQGSSKGSDNNAAPSDWASTSQAATPDDEDTEDEDEVDDEEEEQESRGGVQPNMRDRRTPVNRDLQIGFGSNRPNPDANGRGGPGGQKKSRGVASLVLGVPIPDRVNGQPNKGRIRITQQRITPESEQSDPVSAEDRGLRQGPVGPIHAPDWTPWLQDVVRRYFLQRRARYPLKQSTTTDANPEKTTPVTTTSSDSLKTSRVFESESTHS